MSVTLDGQSYDHVSFIIGLSLAVSSSLFIGSSFIIKKVALKKISASGNVRASAGGFAYLKQWLWWLGFLTNGPAGSAAEYADKMKHRKYSALESVYDFVAVAVETAGSWAVEAKDFIRNLGQRLRDRGYDPRSGSYLVQQISLAIQRGNAAGVMDTFGPVGLGEAANLLAYAFAPAALVTPLGALSVLVSAVLAAKFLNEHLNFIGKIGCFLCIVGSVLIIIHSPKSEELKTFKELIIKLLDYQFLTYVGTIVCMCLIIKVVFVSRYGNKNITVYLLLCSAIGSLTVVFCKAVALGIKETVAGHANNLKSYVFWLLIVASILCIMVQMNYLNKSLDIFNTSVVSPVYYVMFTVLVIIASGILFREWEHMAIIDILGCMCGFLVVMTAIFMLNAFKDVQMTFRDLNLNARRRRSALDVEADINFLNTLHNSRPA